MTEDYDLPPLEEIVAEIIKGVVRDDQIGTERVKDIERYVQDMADDYENPLPVDDDYFDFVLLRRRAGYLTDTFTDVSGLDVEVWARTRSRAISIMNEITKRIINAEGWTFLGFLIDFSMVLNGPEEDPSMITDERMVRKSFEFNIRVKWK